MDGREWRLVRRPVGWPVGDDFELVTASVPEPPDGKVLVRNRFLSVDPYMRGRMNEARSYAPPYQLGEAMHGGAVGEVVHSRADALEPGDWVLHNLGWREYAVLDAARTQRIDPAAVPSPSLYLGALGTTGLTAYVGLLDVAGLRPADTVFVSGAAGAVGSMAGQIARIKGARRIVGSAGSPEKVAFLTEELGFDAAFDYHDGAIAEQLRAAAPDGIDVYFDNVGGEHLEAAISRLNVGGRVAVCGMISQYNATEPPCAPRNLGLIVGKRLTLRGFLVFDHIARNAEFTADVSGWLRDGRLVARETVVDGIEQAVEAFLEMLGGANFGKMVVRLT
jgi:hypothetical protein